MAKKDIQSLLLAARTAEGAGRYKVALNKYSECRKLQEFDSEMLEKLGDLANKTGDEFKALDLYLEAIQKGTGNISPVLKSAIINSRGLLRYSEALELLNTVLEFEPDNKSALKEKLHIFKETNNFEQMLSTATELLKIEKESVEGHCYKGRAYISGKQPNHEMAKFHLEKALSIEPANPMAKFFLALLHIEQTQFESALKMFEEAYDGFEAKKEQNNMNEVSSYYACYKDSVNVAKRKSRFSHISIAEQIEILLSCGIQIIDIAAAKSSLAERPEDDPFKGAISHLGTLDLIANGVGFDTECIVNPGDYAWFAEKFRNIAQGDFPIENIEDDIYIEDEGGRASLAFTLHGKRYKWKAHVKNDWLDINILRKMAALMLKLSSPKRFILISHEPYSNLSVLCLSEKEIALLKDRTALDFEIMGM